MREGGSEPGEVDVCSGEKMIEKSVEPRKYIYICVSFLLKHYLTVYHQTLYYPSSFK